VRALAVLVLVFAPFVFAAPARAAVPPGGLDARSAASHDGARAMVLVGHLERPLTPPAIAGGDADAALRWARMDPLEPLAAVRNITRPTGSARFAASADVDRAAVLVAQDVPAGLLLAAAVVLVVGAALAATIGWRLWRP
jgi:hypothetical protein